MYGGVGNDTLDGGEGSDTVMGGYGNDVVAGGDRGKRILLQIGHHVPGVFL